MKLSPSKASLSGPAALPVPPPVPVEKKECDDKGLATAAKKIPEGNRIPRPSSVCMETADPLVWPDLSGIQRFLALSPQDRLGVIFDRNTCKDFYVYENCEPGKAKYLIKGWDFLIQKVKDYAFFAKPDELKHFIVDLHRHAYPVPDSPKDCKPGELRNERNGYACIPYVMKSKDSIVTSAGLFAYQRRLKEFYQEAGLPAVPGFILMGEQSIMGTKGLPSFLAIDAKCCDRLLYKPPGSKAGLIELLKGTYDQIDVRFQDIEGISCFSNEPYHQYSLQYWNKVLYAGLLKNLTPPENEKQKNPVLYNLENFSDRLRLLILPQEVVPHLLDSWCKDISHSIKNVQTKRELFGLLSRIATEFGIIRPFCDGNCRLLCLLLQGILMTFGQPPVSLTTRYISMQSPEELVEFLIRECSWNTDQTNRDQTNRDQTNRELPSELLAAANEIT